MSRGSAALAVPRQDKEDVAVPDKLNDFALNEATLPIQIFGMELVSLLLLCAIPRIGNTAPCAQSSPTSLTSFTKQVECVYAKQFTHRERALRELSTALAALTAASPRKDVVATAKAIAILLRRLLVDKMAAVSVPSTLVLPLPGNFSSGQCSVCCPLLVEVATVATRWGACPQGHPPTDVGWFGSMDTDTCTVSATSHWCVPQ